MRVEFIPKDEKLANTHVLPSSIALEPTAMVVHRSGKGTSALEHTQKIMKASKLIKRFIIYTRGGC